MWPSTQHHLPHASDRGRSTHSNLRLLREECARELRRMSGAFAADAKQIVTREIITLKTLQIILTKKPMNWISSMRLRGASPSKGRGHSSADSVHSLPIWGNAGAPLPTLPKGGFDRQRAVPWSWDLWSVGPRTWILRLRDQREVHGCATQTFDKARSSRKKNIREDCGCSQAFGMFEIDFCPVDPGPRCPICSAKFIPSLLWSFASSASSAGGSASFSRQQVEPTDLRLISTMKALWREQFITATL